MNQNTEPCLPSSRNRTPLVPFKACMRFERLYSPRPVPPASNEHMLFRCLQCNDKRCDSLEKLEKHCKRCVLGLDDIEEMLPTKNKDDILKFKNVNCTFKHPFYITADFESTLGKVNETCEDKRSQIYQHHIANSYGLKYNCDCSKHSEPMM